MINPFEQYKKTSINTMTKGELLLLVYDELIKKLNMSKLFIENSDFVKSKENLNKCRKIISYLLATLDDSYEISNNLRELYLFLNREITKAAAFNKVNYIDDILPIAKELRDTWAEADKLSKTEKA